MTSMDVLEFLLMEVNKSFTLAEESPAVTNSAFRFRESTRVFRTDVRRNEV